MKQLLDLTQLRPMIVQEPSVQRRVIYSILNSFGMMGLNMAENTVVADRYLRFIRKDIIFIDVHSQPLSGLSFAKRLRFNEKHHNARTTLFLLLDEDPTEEVYEAMRHGYLDGFIMRPFNMTNMYDALTYGMAA